MADYHAHLYRCAKINDSAVVGAKNEPAKYLEPSPDVVKSSRIIGTSVCYAQKNCAATRISQLIRRAGRLDDEAPELIPRKAGNYTRQDPKRRLAQNMYSLCFHPLTFTTELKDGRKHRYPAFLPNNCLLRRAFVCLSYRADAQGNTLRGRRASGRTHLKGSGKCAKSAHAVGRRFVPLFRRKGRKRYNERLRWRGCISDRYTVSYCFRPVGSFQWGANTPQQMRILPTHVRNRESPGHFLILIRSVPTW